MVSWFAMQDNAAFAFCLAPFGPAAQEITMLRAVSSRRGLIPLLLVFAFACEGGSKPMEPQPQGITIALSATSLEITQGASATATVTLTRTGTFTGAVTIAAETLPNGVTAADVTIPAGQTSAQVTFNATASAPTLTGTARLRATGTGVDAATANLSLTIRAKAGNPGGFTMALASPTRTIAQGASDSVALNITRTGDFAGAVNLTASGAPAGLTVTLNPASAGGNQAWVRVGAGGTVAAGTYPLTIRGTATGVTEQTATLNVTVTAVQSAGNVTWRFCPLFGRPVWLAFQDGNGAWTAVTGANDTYSFQINSGRGGVAYVLPEANNGAGVEVFYGTLADLQARGQELCGNLTGEPKSVNVSVSGIGGTDMAFTTLGRGLLTFNLATPATQTTNNATPGTIDYVGARNTLSLQGISAVYTLSGLMIVRNQNPAAGSTVSFNFAQAVAPAEASVNIGNLLGETAIVTTAYYTANNTFATLSVSGAGSTASTQSFRGFPANLQQDGDLHFMNVTAMQNVQDPQHMRNVSTYFKTVANKQLTLGGPLNPPTVTQVATAPYRRARISFEKPADYGRFWYAQFQQSTAPTRRWQIQMTTGYHNSNNAIALEMPDLSAAGFNTTWALRAEQTGWALLTAGWDGVGGVNSAPFAENTLYKSATRSGLITLN